MSDLCHNCGSCHLPRPCDYPPVHCDICNNFGHSYNFCPTSVWNKNPAYQYWMLCHNCDSWHLPQPCQQELHRCLGCNASGHLEVFCPVQPGPRTMMLPSPATSTIQTGVKRQRTDESDACGMDQKPQIMDAEAMRQIKYTVAKDVINLLRTKTADQVLNIMANPVEQASALPPIQTLINSSLNGIGNVNVPAVARVNSGNTHNANSDVSPYGNPYVPISKQMRTSPPEPATPASATKEFADMVQHNDGSESVYAAMHDRFADGDLLTAYKRGNATDSLSTQTVKDTNQQEQAGPRPFVPSQSTKITHGTSQQNAAEFGPLLQSANAESQQTPQAKPKKRRASPHPRCEECKKSRKRCNHIKPDTGTVSRTPSHEVAMTNMPEQAMQPPPTYQQTPTFDHSAMANAQAAGQTHANGDGTFSMLVPASSQPHAGSESAYLADGQHAQSIMGAASERNNFQDLFGSFDNAHAVPSLDDIGKQMVGHGQDSMPAEQAQVQQPSLQQHHAEHAQNGQQLQPATTSGMSSDGVTTESAASEAAVHGNEEKAEPKKRGRPKQKK